MSGNGFAGKLQALLPTIRERRAEIEQARRLPRDLVDGLSATGIFRLGVPRALGGDEADPLDQLLAIETVSAADGSTGWCTMLGVGSGVVAGYMPDAGAKEVFADPSTPKALVAEPIGAARDTDGGLLVSGRWRFASGITHSDWVVTGCMVMEGDQPRMTPHGPQIAHTYMPVSEVEIHDTWHVSGMIGTGSFDVSCTDVFVPEERVLSLFNPARRPEPLYQMPVLSLVAPHIAVVGVGIARTALDELIELAETKVPALSFVPMAQKPVTQIEIARCEGTLGAARSFLYDALDDLWQTVQTGTEPSMRQRSLVRIAALKATEAASHVTRTVNTLAGSNSIYNSSSIQRHARDVEAITHHMSQSPQTWENAGRVLFGLEPTFPLF